MSLAPTSRRQPSPSGRVTRTTRALAGSPKNGPLLSSVTCTGDGLDHRVSDIELSEAHRSGRWRAVCGRLVLPAPMVAPAGPACPHCATLATTDQHSPTARGWLWPLRQVSGRTPVSAPRESDAD